MTVTFSIAAYFIIWWTVLFVVLPFGVHTQGEAGHVVPGTPESAPAHFRVGRVALITTLLSLAVLFVIWAGIALRIIDLETLVSHM